MFKTNARSLATALSRVLPAIVRHRTIPVLSTARLRVEASVLTLSGTNLDIQLDAEATIEATGPSAEVCVDPRPLLAMLRMLSSSDTVDIAKDGETIVATWNGGRMRLPTVPPSDFPGMQPVNPAASARFDSAAHDALARVVPFISSEETRYYLNGVCLDRHDGMGVFVATDGHRLAVMPGGGALTALMGALGVGRPIVPRQTAALWLAMASRDDVDVAFTGDGLRLSISREGERLRSKLIDGTFPSWDRVLPDRQAMRPIELPRVALARGCAFLGQFGAGCDHALVVAEGRVQLRSKALGVGEMAVDLGPCDAPDFTLGVNARYLRAAVAATRGGAVTVWVRADEESAGPIEVAGSDADAAERVAIMPLRHARAPAISAPVPVSAD